MPRLPLILALLPALAGPARAFTLDDVHWGKEVVGPLPTRAEMDGRVVVLESCFPENVDRFALLLPLYKELAPRGLIVIAMLMQDDQAAAARTVFARLQPALPVMGFTRVDDGAQGMANQMCYVFDHTGVCVYHAAGAPDAPDAIRRAVDAAPDWVLGARPIEKLPREAAAIRARKNLGQTAAALEQFAEDDDADRRDEARYLLDRLDRFARLREDRARRLEADDPPAALATWQELARDFGGCAIGARAEERLAALKKDPAFQRELAAAAAFARLEKSAAALDPRRPNPAQAAALKATFARFERQYEGTRAADRARRLRDELGLGG